MIKVLVTLVLGVNLVSAFLMREGFSDNLSLPRVVNGTDSDITRFPFMVSLRRSTGSHMCGASLINSRWVLTAAHCLGSMDPNYYTIQHSSSIINTTNDNVANIIGVFPHEDYNSTTIENDVGLLKLERNLHIREFVQIAPNDMMISSGNPAILIGWGLEKTNGTVQMHLQEVDLYTYSASDCRERHIYDVFDSNVCAGVEGGGKGQCSGDSGGPLLVDGYQVGIVSWSMKPCTIAPFPGVFTSVHAFRDWIDQTIADNSDD